MSERRSLAAPEELSIAGLEKYKEICHKVLTVCSGQGIRDQSDQESEVRCFSLLLMFLFLMFGKKVFNQKCFTSLSPSND